MNKEIKMFDEIKDLVPDDILMVEIRRETSIPYEKESINLQYGFTLKPGESQLTREQAIDLYNKIRGRLPDIISASFLEEQDMEWEFELSFLRSVSHEHQTK